MKNTKKFRNVFVLLVLALIFAVSFTFAGCSSGVGYGSKSSNNSGAFYADEMYDGNSGALANYDSVEYEYGAAEAPALNLSKDEILAVAAESSGTSTSSNLPADRKIIRDANVTIEVEDVEKSFDKILAILARYGGYEANRDMRVNSYNSPTVNATFKIPAAKLDMFLIDLKDEGYVISSNISSADITDQYYDSKTRLTTLEKTLEKYYEFLDNAKDVDEQLKVTRYINDLTNEIEQLKGSLKRWDSLVDYSTVTLYLYKTYEALAEERIIEWSSLSFDDMKWLISSGFVGVCSVIVNVLQRILIFVVSGAPILIPLALVLFFVIRHSRKKKKQAQKVQQEQQVQQVQNDKPE